MTPCVHCTGILNPLCSEIRPLRGPQRETASTVTERRCPGVSWNGLYMTRAKFHAFPAPRVGSAVLWSEPPCTVFASPSSRVPRSHLELAGLRPNPDLRRLRSQIQTLTKAPCPRKLPKLLAPPGPLHLQGPASDECLSVRQARLWESPFSALLLPVGVTSDHLTDLGPASHQPPAGTCCPQETGACTRQQELSRLSS